MYFYIMYRYRHNDVPKWYFACTEVVQQKTHVPKWISCVPKSSCTESVHPFVPKLSCTENDVTHPFPTRAIRSAWRSCYAARTSLVAPASERASSITCVQVLGPTAQPCLPRRSQPTGLIPLGYMSSASQNQPIIAQMLTFECGCFIFQENLKFDFRKI